MSSLRAQSVAGLLLPLAFVSLSGCGSPNQPKETVIARAYTGPVTLALREEIDPESGTAATSRHGQTLEVLQIRRRFVRVRTEDGTQGWTEMRNLVNDKQMEALREQMKYAAKLPSQGQATVYEPLNVHMEPKRRSTSFYQITPKMKVDVVGHELVPRDNTLPPPAIEVSRPKPRPRRKKREPRASPIPRPPAPALPANWQELSQSPFPPPPPPPAPKVPMEDWSLVRTADGNAGWVLTRNLVMAIPDEVAQYSEGARITSYFPLGEVRDGDQVKHHWLWTTIRGGGQPYEFDSFRVFIYMLRRHRYETAYIERGVEGYYPVEATKDGNAKFSLILRGADGQLYRKTWVLEGYVVRKIGEQPVQMPKRYLASGSSGGEPEESDEEDSDEGDDRETSLLERLKEMFRRS